MQTFIQAAILYCCVDANVCLSNPCNHGGTCSNYGNSYTCACQGTYDGKNCEGESLVKYQTNSTLLIERCNVYLLQGSREINYIVRYVWRYWIYKDGSTWSEDGTTCYICLADWVCMHTYYLHANCAGGLSMCTISLSPTRTLKHNYF